MSIQAFRIPIIAVSLSAAGLVGIVLREGYTDEAIIPTKGDVPTVGFGSTTGVKLGDRTTPPKALLRAATELDSTYEKAVKSCVKVPVSQVEYDVYVSMAYNIGSKAFCNSSIVSEANRLKYKEACGVILRYKFAAGYDCSTPGNKRCAGLWQDRLRDHAKCMSVQG